MHIAHRPFDHQRLEQYYEIALRGIESSKQLFDGGKYFVLRDMYGKTLDAACCAVVLGKSKEEIKRSFDLFLEVALGKYKMGTHVGKEITFTFLGREYTYVPEAKPYSLSDQGWITAFFSALLFLDLDTISALNEIDLEIVKKVTRATGGDHTFYFAEFLQHGFEGDRDDVANLQKVTAAIDPELVHPDAFAYAHAIIGGQVELFGAALVKEAPHFNQVFATTVGRHKDHYRGEQQGVEGLVSIPLTAIAVLARKYGITLEHSSDYTPAIFLDGF